MNPNDFDANTGHDHDHDSECEHEVQEALEEALELDTQSQIFLEMRRQNLDLLRLATEVAGFRRCTRHRSRRTTSRAPCRTSGKSSPSSTPGSTPRRPRAMTTTRISH